MFVMFDFGKLGTQVDLFIHVVGLLFCLIVYL